MEEVSSLDGGISSVVTLCVSTAVTCLRGLIVVYNNIIKSVVE